MAWMIPAFPSAGFPKLLHEPATGERPLISGYPLPAHGS